MPALAPGRVERGIAAALGGAAALAVVGAGVDLGHQAQVLASQRLLAAQGLALARGDPVIHHAGRIAMDAPPVALVNAALIDARAAEASADRGARKRLLARAAWRIDRARGARDRWGEAEVVAAYVAAAEAGTSGDARTLRLLATSYRDAPLLRHGGMWRVGVGLDHYSTLDLGTRRRIIEEGVLLARIDNASRTAIFERARTSAGYRPLLARWHAARAGDADRIAR